MLKCDFVQHLLCLSYYSSVLCACITLERSCQRHFVFGRYVLVWIRPWLLLNDCWHDILQDYKRPVGISPNWQLRCSWAQRWTSQILRSEGEMSSSQRTINGQISTSGLGGIFSPFSRMHWGKSSELVQCVMLKACDACADMGQL